MEDYVKMVKPIEEQISYPQCLIDRKRFKDKYLWSLDELVKKDERIKILLKQIDILKKELIQRDDEIKLQRIR